MDAIKLKKVLHKFVLASDLKNNLQEFIASYNSETTTNPMDSTSRIWKNKVVSKVTISLDNKTIWLKDLRSLETRQGYAAQFMKWLCSLADKKQVDIMLSPVPYTQNISEQDLIRFYGKFDFVKKGEFMYRKTSEILKLSNKMKIIPL